MSAAPEVLSRYMEGLKSHDVPAILATVAEDLRFESMGRVLDRKAFGEMLTALYKAFPDWTYDHDAPVGRDDGWDVLWRQGGTHVGEFAMPGMEPIAATGRVVRIPPQRFHYRIDSGLITRIRPDPVEGGAPRGILLQIGAAEPPL